MAAPDNLVVAVIGIPYDATADDVRGVFAGCGTMSAFDMPTFEVRGGAVHARARVCTTPLLSPRARRPQDSGRNKGKATITFTTVEEAAAAIALNGCELQGRWLKIVPFVVRCQCGGISFWGSVAYAPPAAPHGLRPRRRLPARRLCARRRRGRAPHVGPPRRPVSDGVRREPAVQHQRGGAP